MDRRHIKDQSSKTLISDEDGTRLIQSDKGKTPESGLSVCPLSRSSTVVGFQSDKGKTPESGLSACPLSRSSMVPGIGQVQTSSNSTGLNLERPPTVQNVAAGRTSKKKKLKATASMATWLRIGLWERKEIYVGDIVGRCYYCSQKLAWEVTEGGWRRKIEFGWSKIIGMQTIVNDDDSVTLNLELKEPPIFYVEEQVVKAKKQTTWLKSADFTDGGQASTFRRHSIRFEAGVFVEVYADLLSSDERLFALTQKPFPTLNSPFFGDSPTELSNGNPFSAAVHSQPFFPISSPSLHPSNLIQSPLPPQINQQLRFSSPSLHPSNLTQLPPQINQQLRFSSPSMHPSNLTQLPPQINQQVQFCSPSLHPSNLTQLPPPINQQLRFSSPSSSQLAPLLLQPNQHFPISSSFPTNVAPLPLQPSQHFPISSSFPTTEAPLPLQPSQHFPISSSFPTNVAPLPLQPSQHFPISSSFPTNVAPLPLQPSQHFPISSSFPTNVAPLPLQPSQHFPISSSFPTNVAPPPLQPSQHFPISSSFPMNLTPLPLQQIPPLHHWPIVDDLVKSSHWRDELGSPTNLTPLLPPLRMSLSNPDSRAPLPLQINQQHLMNQHLDQITNPHFHPISENVLPNQTVGSSSSTAVLPDEMLDIDWLLDYEEDATNVVPVLPEQTVGISSSTTVFPDETLDIDWLLDYEEDATNVVPVLPEQTVGSSSSTTVFPDETLDIDWLLDYEEDATNVVPNSGDLWDALTQYRGQSNDQQHFPNNCS